MVERRVLRSFVGRWSGVEWPEGGALGVWGGSGRTVDCVGYVLRARQDPSDTYGPLLQLWRGIFRSC